MPLRLKQGHWSITLTGAQQNITDGAPLPPSQLVRFVEFTAAHANAAGFYQGGPGQALSSTGFGNYVPKPDTTQTPAEPKPPLVKGPFNAADGVTLEDFTLKGTAADVVHVNAWFYF